MKYYLLITFIALSIYISAQKPPITWKKVPMEDLKMKTYELDTSASAVVLCDYGKYYFDTNPGGQHLFVYNSRHVRIKILKQEGLKYTKVKIPYEDLNCQRLFGESTIELKAFTYNLSSKGELEYKKIKRKSMTFRDSTNCIKIVEFDFPDVKVGSIIDLYYNIATLEMIEPQSWVFQWDIPVRHSEFRMRAITDFDYLYSPQNFSDFDVAEETYYSRTFSVSGRFYGYYIRRPIHYDLSGKQIQFIRKNIKAFKEKNFMNDPESYRQKLNIHLFKAVNRNQDYIWKRISHQLFITTNERYDEMDYLQRNNLFYPAGYIIYKLHDWESFALKLEKSSRFGLPLIKFWDYQPHLNNMIEGKTNDLDKMTSIYDYVRQNIRWNGKQNIYVNSVFNPVLSKVYTKVTKKVVKEKSLSKPFNAKTGSNAEINFILISLLRKANIEAHPVILNTKKAIDKNIPSPKQFDHVIALARIGSNEYFLDATDSLRPYNLLSTNCINKEGYLIKGNNFEWIKIQNNNISSTIVKETLNIEPDLSVNRKIQVKKTGYHSIESRKTINKNGIAKSLNNIKQELHVDSDLKIKNLDKDSLPLIFISENKQKVKHNELKIKIKLSPNYSKADFDEFIRVYPVEFKFPFIKEYQLSFNLPEGFEYTCPKNDELSTYGGNASYKISTEKKGNTVYFNIRLSIKLQSFSNMEYSNLAELFTYLNQSLEESIIIHKKDKI